MQTLQFSVVLLLLGISSFHYVKSQKCIAPAKKPGQIFPDLFQIAKTSYVFNIEANDAINKVTTYIVETVDIKGARSRTDVTDSKGPRGVLALSTRNEFFLFEGETICETTYFTNVNWTAFPWVLNVPDAVLTGPSYLIREAYLAWKNEPNTIGAENDFKTIRGMSCSVWTWCNKGGKTVKLYFTDPSTEHPFGLSDIPVPARVTVGDGDTVTHTYEFFRMMPDVQSELIEKKFQIPAERGCKRLTKVREAPSFDDKDMYLEAEILYTPIRDNAREITYVTNVKYLLHKNSNVVAFEWTPWKTNKDKKGFVKTGNDIFWVYDLKSGYQYTIDKTLDNCNITKDKVFQFTFPDGQTFSDMDLFEMLVGSDATSYHFLGQTEERGIPVAVFEKSVEGDNGLKDIITTRYYMDEKVELESESKERNSPLKVVISDYDLMHPENIEEYIINIYDFQSHLKRIHQLLDVSLCFQDENQSKGFQIIFPLGKYKSSDVLPFLSVLRNDLIGLLQNLVQNSSPLRIPSLQVDLDEQNIYVSGNILERPDFIADFTYRDKMTLKESEKLGLVGVVTLSDCAKSCLHMSQCQFFSYCGAICVIATETVSEQQDTETKAGCTLYKNTVFPHSMLTMDQLSSSMKAAVDTLSLSITLPKSTGDLMDFTADTYTDGLPLGLDKLGLKPEGNPESWFDKFKPGFRLSQKLADNGIRLSKTSFESCRTGCSRMTSCESFSYCLITGDCILSVSQRDDIGSEVEENSQCMIMTRNYLDRYKKFPGTTAVLVAQKTSEDAKTPEACAKVCYQQNEFDCKSFDFCPYEKKTSCYMHKQHFDSDATEIAIAEAGDCTHYSRNEVHDFKVDRNKDMSNNVPGLKLVNVTPEQCARLCKELKTKQPCAGFDHCGDPLGTNTTCILRKVSKEPTKDNKQCNSYLWKTNNK